MPGWNSLRWPRAAAAGLVAAGLTATVALSSADAASSALSATPVQVWETTADQAQLLARQPDLAFGPGGGAVTPPHQICILILCFTPPGPPVIAVDDTQRFQQIDGFGAALTDSSAHVLLHDMAAPQRAAAIKQIFDRQDGIGVDYLRVPIGANDFSTSNYALDDVPAGQRDPALAHFSIQHDLAAIVPVLKQALAVNPAIKIMGTAWSAPAWMKTNGALVGGSLNAGDVDAYARYLVRYVRAYARQGIRITALTLGNEPDYSPPGYPGMTLTAAQEATLAPVLAHALAASGLTTQIIGFDSVWADAKYATALLSSPPAAAALTGTAFHCYAGDATAQLAVHDAHPDKGIYLTECSGYARAPDFATNLVNATRGLLINGVRAWAKTVLLWNLALDERHGPTNGGCADCVPNVTVDSATGAATYNVEHYALGQVSKFVRAGAHRVASTDLGPGSVETVAFQNPDGSDVLVALNTNGAAQTGTVRWRGQSFAFTIPPGAVQTFSWGGTAAAPAR